MKMNRKRRYKGFNKKTNIAKIRVFTTILCLSLIGAYGYIKLKDNSIVGNFNIVKSIGQQFQNISLKNMFKADESSTVDEYNYDDVSNE